MSDGHSDGMDLEALRDGVRAVLTEQASHEKVAAFTNAEGVRDEPLWSQAAELGWLALSADEAHGGLGLGSSELAIVYEELGRALAPLPVLGTMLVVEALARGGDAAQQAAWTPRLAAGELAGAVSMLTPGDRTTRLTLSAGADGGVTLDGVAADLLDGAAADILLLLAREGEGLSWVLVEPALDGVVVEKVATVDRTRRLGEVRFDRLALPAGRVLMGDAGQIADALLAHAALALASDARGGANAVFEITLDYLKTREQFGKPIGSFQALKHRCADHKIALVASGALVAEAVARMASGDPAAGRYALAAKALATEVYARVAQDAVQLHGGIGYTWEHPCHLYLKRAKLNEQLFGGPAAYLDRVTDLLLAAA
ncbi:acyl-CoA dehydrogenase family protein [Caulobacter rhizosphaerae]|uniref:acyl-CoA dehydrogenase family protein n=1 Tax=Caulobacter rhizosphaerae TaxID=2010972 RepID=UPI0013D2D6A2|nr:acyl-CoA dehydrogenase family protein [Caulobacter rhizosphaerae]GGL47138.1 acyl-CoA dehydrogenase [Caulobacter rhizosphaerae]